MNRRTSLVLTALAVPALVLPATAAAAGSDRSSGTQNYRATLEELNHSGATGTAKLQLRGDQLTVTIKARGLLPNSVHAQHIHGKGTSECPPPSAAGADGILNVVEGVPFYGPIVTSLTTSGDTSAAAGLAVDLMPVADDRGRIDYRRTVTLPADASRDLEDYQVVQHGVDLNGSGAYDFGPGPSELNAAFPLEATVPANCGTIDHLGHGHGH